MTPNTIGAGRYRVRGVLGHSQYATVYDAYDIDRDESVAIKVLSLSAPAPEIARAMYEREVGALDGFEHDFVVRMRRFFAEDDEQRLLIVLDRIPGGQCLEKLIEDPAPPPCTRRLRWRIEQLLGVLDGLGYAHRRGVIHRDIKLGNILLDHETDRLMLVDFGIARILENYAAGEVGTTLRAFYSRPYAAPEQVLSRETSFPADLYAFGVVAASLLTWQLPPADLAHCNFASFLAPLDDSIDSTDGARRLRETLFKLLQETPSTRPHVADVELALRVALDALTEREPLSIRVTNNARNQVRTLALDSFEIALEDLNTGPRVIYEPDEEGDNYAILVLGRSLQALFRPDKWVPDKLVLVNLFRQHPGTHTRKREGAAPAPFLLEPGDGSAQALIDLAWEDFQKRERAREERRQREDALFIARFILEKQRERMTTLEVRYSVDKPESVS